MLASVAFCKGAIGKPEENVDVADAFFASRCASPFPSEIGVRSGPRRVELKAAPSVFVFGWAILYDKSTFSIL